MTQTTTPRPLTIAVEDVRRGDVIVTPEGVRCYAAFDLEALTSGDVKVWTAVRDQEAGRPSSLVLHAGTTVLIAGPEDLEDNDQDTEDRQVAGERAAAQAEFGPVDKAGALLRDVLEVIDGSPARILDRWTVGADMVRVVLEDHGPARLAAAALLQAGYEVARDGQRVTVTRSED